MTQEKFLNIKDYEGLYQVSDLGRVRSLKWNKERILKPGKDTSGYLLVDLYKDGKRKMIAIHRLVLTTFNPVSNMDELTVDHINMDKTDNRLSNLRYATKKEQRYFDNQDWCSHAKKVYQYDIQGNFIKEWDSTMEIERELGFSHGNISQYCLGKRKSAYNYIWTYEKRID